METFKNFLKNLFGANHRRLYIAFAAIVTTVYLSLAIGAAITKSPWVDEAWFASPAFNLATKGFMGTTVLEASGTWLEGIDKFTYWIPPAYILAQAAWYEIFGFSLLTMRALSVAFGLAALVSWFFFVKSLTGEIRAALLAFTIIALDYCFIMIASVGRMDMMSAALNVSGFAAFMLLRERNFTRAVLIGNIFVAASVFTHPTGVLGFAGLVFLTVYFDWKRVKLRHPLIAAAPYLIGAGLWSVYILQAPELFLAQFGGNVNGVAQTNRWAGLASPLTALSNEITNRYLSFYGFNSDSTTGLSRLKIFILIAYAAGIIAAFCTTEIRRNKGRRGLLLLTAVYFILLLILDGHKQVMYLVHIIPMFAAVLAVVVEQHYRSRPKIRLPLIAGVLGLILLQIGGVLFVIKKNERRAEYQPVIELLKADSDAQNNLVAGSAELGFGLEFADNFTDDWRFGFHSKRKPRFIVIGKQYRSMINRLREQEPETHRYATEMLNREYRQIYDDGSTKIFKR
jgi:4-amino-4-deoxy-L-arabinose transferase-like glycosyltransferase